MTYMRSTTGVLSQVPAQPASSTIADTANALAFMVPPVVEPECYTKASAVTACSTATRAWPRTMPFQSSVSV